MKIDYRNLVTRSKVLEELENTKQVESLAKEIITKNFQNLKKHKNTQVQKYQKSPAKFNSAKSNSKII